MGSPCTITPPAACVPAIADARVLASFARRFNTSTNQALVPIPPHTPNGDEMAYADKCGTYCKGLKQSSPGKVDLPSFNAFRAAIASGQFADFEALTLGAPAP